MLSKSSKKSMHNVIQKQGKNSIAPHLWDGLKSIWLPGTIHWISDDVYVAGISEIKEILNEIPKMIKYHLSHK